MVEERLELNKFKLDYRKAVDIWGRDCVLPVYDGLMVIAKTKKEEHIIANIYWDAKIQDCFMELVPGIDLELYIKNYKDFKDFCAIIKHAEYHIALAHKVIRQ